MKKFLKDFNLLGFLMLGLCVVLGVGDVSGAVIGADGAATALENGTEINTDPRGALETHEYRQYADGLIDDPVDQKIVKIRPYATPLDTILRYAGTQKTNNLEFEYYSISARGLALKVTSQSKGSAVAANAKDRATCTLQVASDSVLALDQLEASDTIMFPTVLGNDGKPLMVYVYSKTGTNPVVLNVTCPADQVTVDSGDSSKFNIPTIANNTEGYIMGRAAAETDVLSPATEFLPEKSRGYCQIFKCQISASNYAIMADKEVKWDLSEIEEEALYDFRRREELSFLFGSMAKIYDPTKKKYVYTTGGIVNGIANKHTLYAGEPDGNAQIVDMMKHIFVGNSGSNTRYALAGADAIARISKLQKVEKQQDAVKTEVVWGITWSKIVTNFGTLNLVMHPIMNECGYSDKMIVVDPQFLKKWQVLNFERQEIDGKAHAIVNGKMVVFTETAGVAVYNPKAHCVVTVEEGTAESGSSI